MDDAVEVGVLEGIRDIRHPPHRLLLGWLLGNQPIRQASSLYVLGDDEAGVVLHPHVVDRDDAVVLEPGNPTCLGLECLGRFETAGLGQFEGDSALQFTVVRTKHLGKSTLGDQFIEPIAVGQRPRLEGR